MNWGGVRVPTCLRGKAYEGNKNPYPAMTLSSTGGRKWVIRWVRVQGLEVRQIKNSSLLLHKRKWSKRVVGGGLFGQYRNSLSKKNKEH